MDISGKLPLTTFALSLFMLLAFLPRVPQEERSELIKLLTPKTNVSTTRDGFIEKNGRFVIQPKFSHAWSFRKGIAKVEHENWSNEDHFISLRGELTKHTSVEKDEYEQALNYKLPMVLESLDHKHEVEHGPFFGGLAKARRQGSATYGFIDVEGNWVIEPRFKSAESFSENLACVSLLVASDSSDRDKVERFGFIDRSGKFVIPAVFQHARSFSEGYAAVTVNTQHLPATNYLR